MNELNKITPGRESFSFLKAYNQVPLMYAAEVKKAIMIALSIKNRAAWYQRLYGNVEPKVSEAAAIEKVFEKYGIKDVWGK